MNILIQTLEDTNYKTISFFDFSLQRRRTISENIIKSLLNENILKKLLNNAETNLEITYQDTCLLLIKRAYLLEAINSYLEKYSLEKTKEINQLISKYSYYNLLNTDTIYQKEIDGTNYKIPTKDFFDFLELEDNYYSLYTSAKENYFRGIPINIFIYALMDYFQNILGNYILPNDIKQRIIELKDQVIDYESVNTYLKISDPFIDKVKINTSLKEKMIFDKSNKLLSIFLTYLNLCKTFTYSKDYYIDPLSDEGMKHTKIERLETLKEDNNELVCFEFISIFSSYLKELGINYQVVELNDHNEQVNIEYGYTHNYIIFRLDKYLIKIDPVVSVLASDLTNAKINNTLNGFECINKNYNTRQEFLTYLKKVYQVIKPNLDDIYLPQTKVINSQVLSIKKQQILERIDKVLAKAKEKDLNNVDKISYILGLIKLEFNLEERNTLINTCLVSENNKLLIVFTINDSTYMNLDNTYLVLDNNALEIINKEELETKINNHVYEYINDRIIPGLKSKKK